MYVPIWPSQPEYTENAGLEDRGWSRSENLLLLHTQRGAAEGVKPPMVMARVRWQCKELSRVGKYLHHPYHMSLHFAFPWFVDRGNLFFASSAVLILACRGFFFFFFEYLNSWDHLLAEAGSQISKSRIPNLESTELLTQQ